MAYPSDPVESRGFEIKDSGTRQEFAGGMVRDTAEGKINFLSVRFGPMLKRWAAHLTAGREKYPDPTPGRPNWTLAEGEFEFLRAKESAARHFEQWLDGDRDEDHAAGVIFNINLAEYVLEKANGLFTVLDPGLGARADARGPEEMVEFNELPSQVPDNPETRTMPRVLSGPPYIDKPWRIVGHTVDEVIRVSPDKVLIPYDDKE